MGLSLSTYGDVVDSTTGGATLLNDHIDSRLVSNGTHILGMRIRIYGEDYAIGNLTRRCNCMQENSWAFSACYIVTMAVHNVKA